MQAQPTNPDIPSLTLQRAGEIFADHQQSIYKHTDRLFAVLMSIQWVAGILAALWISPRTWIGTVSQTHIHVWAAIFLGAAINVLPIALAVKKPGATSTRYVIATAQMMMSALLIHLTGGRIETHFHVFGSLAFLSFYRDWRVLLPATIVVAADHFLRGFFWPASVYGVLAPSEWRWLEHAGWVLFEDVILVVAIRRSVAEMWDIAVRTAETNDLNQSLEQRVADRTAEIVRASNGLQRQIVERKLAESALRDSEERYRLLFERNPLPMWVYDRDTLAFLAVNEAACQHYGYSREEFLAMTISDIRPPEDVPSLLDSLSQAQSGLHGAGVWKHRKSDGTIVDVEITSYALEFADRPAKLVLVNDITERKRVEEALQTSEEEHRSIFDNATMGIYRSTADGTVIKANLAFARMLGYDSVEEIVQLNLALDVYYYPEQRAKLIAQSPTGSADDVEILWKKKDGTPIWVHLNARAVLDESGRTVCFDTCIHDVTNRVQAEEALRNSERRFSQAFNASPQPMSITTLAEGRYIDINESFVSISGYGREELIGHTSAELRIWPTTDARKQLIDLLNQQGFVRNTETQLRTKSGDLRVLLSSAEVVELAGERCLLIASSDITERKSAEQALAEANERALTEYKRLVERIAALGQSLGNARDLTTIFRSLRDFAVVSVPCDGMMISLYEQEKETRKAAYCWADDQEFDPNSLSGIPVRDGLTGRAIKSGSVHVDNDFQEELRRYRNPVIVGDCTDDRVARSALSAPMTIMGRTIGCVEIQSYQAGVFNEEHVTAMRMAANLAATAVENVTLIEREQAKEEQLRQSQKMEAVGQLAGGVAHDFNNLLTAITGYSELTLRGLDQNSSLRPKVEEIKRAGERAASLTRQLLAFSRKQILQPKVLALNAVIPDMEKMLCRLIGEDIVLRTVLDERLGHVKADPGQIEQILMNLAINARDAMPSGGSLTIETKNVSLDRPYVNQQVVLKAGHYVMLSVSDSGCGMNAETQARIFEPFFTTKEVGKGTGLGLSTVYGIVKQSEGSIWVYSEVGKGTTFKIYLPRVDQVVETEEATDGSKSASRGHETILLVEDEEMVRTLAIEILEGYGYTVIAAANGEEGLSRCREFSAPIDLMITDVVMPHMSGRELAAELRSVRPETRVLYMSGFTDDAIFRHGLLADEVAFIQKPFSPDALARKAREVLDQSDNPPSGRSSLLTLEGVQ
jgi:PAS domain S-box-containing protein